MVTNPREMPSPALNLDFSTTNRCTTVTCHGKMNAETSNLFKDTLKKLIARSSNIVLDLGDVSYMDSSGLGTLMGVYASARKEDCDFRLLNLSRRVSELLHTTGLAGVFKIEGNLL
jgi:anti-sigma B factor antagonist